MGNLINVTDIIPHKDVTLESLYDTPEGKRVLSCIQCGTCSGTCPYGDTMTYTPRRIIKMMQLGLIDEVTATDSLLMCVNCYACSEKCPQDIHLTEVLLQLVKEQMLLNLVEFPSELQSTLENLYRYGNPMGESERKRAEWVKKTDVPVRILKDDPKPTDVLWFVESYSAYYPRGQDVCRSIARILHSLNIDFAILGNEERSAGECGLLSWEPGLSEALVEHNLKVLGKYKYNSIITSDPHAIDAFNYRYRLYGFDKKVRHVVELIADRMDELKPKLTKKLDYLVTYHDSCCLGRHNNVFDEPRELLKAIPGIKLKEMIHNRENTICCGGGGGGMWLDTYYKEKGMERLSDRRIKEAIKTGADVLAIACPYEISRFEDALKVAGYDDKMKVKDIVELLDESMGN